MWLSLIPNDAQRVSLVDRQSIWPAPDGTDAEMIITLKAELLQTVLLATPRVCRIHYRIDSVDAAMHMDNRPTVPWPQAAALKDHSFELMLTEKGAMIVPTVEGKIPARLRSWLNLISEDMRSCWAVPPDAVTEGQTWRLLPAVPGGLPPGTSAARVEIDYQLDRLRDNNADVGVDFAVTVTIEADGVEKQGEGSGHADIALHREIGLRQGERRGRMEISDGRTRNQVIRSSMQVVCRAGDP